MGGIWGGGDLGWGGFGVGAAVVLWVGDPQPMDFGWGWDLGWGLLWCSDGLSSPHGFGANAVVGIWMGSGIWGGGCCGAMGLGPSAYGFGVGSGICVGVQGRCVMGYPHPIALEPTQSLGCGWEWDLGWGLL